MAGWDVKCAALGMLKAKLCASMPKGTAKCGEEVKRV